MGTKRFKKNELRSLAERVEAREGAVRLTCMKSGEDDPVFVVSQARWGEIGVLEKGFLPG